MTLTQFLGDLSISLFGHVSLCRFVLAVLRVPLWPFLGLVSFWGCGASLADLTGTEASYLPISRRGRLQCGP